MGAKLQLRIDEALAARIREGARKVGWNESQFTRYLLTTALGDAPRMAVLEQVAWSISAKVAKNATRIGAAVRSELERLLEDDDDGE